MLPSEAEIHISFNFFALCRPHPCILAFISSGKSLEKIMRKKQPKKVKGRKVSKEPQPKSWVPDELARQLAENFVEKVKMPIGR